MALITSFRMGNITTSIQNDNFMIYDNRSGIAIRSRGTYGTTGPRLAIQDDGNLVLYDTDGKPIWATMSIGRG